jgi:uncharacterized protein (UPF0332 family)
MTLDELEAEGLIAKARIGRDKIDDSLNLARRDTETAGTLVGTDNDWAYSIAYNAMLQAARALMFSMGYRPTGRNQHVSAVRFVQAALAPGHEDITILFERMRRNRHISVYDTAGTISKTQAGNAVSKARQMLVVVEEKIGD